MRGSSHPRQDHCITSDDLQHLNMLTLFVLFLSLVHGSLNVPIEHHPTIRYMVYNGYYKVMSNIPKMGQLPTPVVFACFLRFFWIVAFSCFLYPSRLHPGQKFTHQATYLSIPWHYSYLPSSYGPRRPRSLQGRRHRCYAWSPWDSYGFGLQWAALRTQAAQKSSDQKKPMSSDMAPHRSQILGNVNIIQQARSLSRTWRDLSANRDSPYLVNRTLDTKLLR